MQSLIFSFGMGLLGAGILICIIVLPGIYYDRHPDKITGSGSYSVRNNNRHY